MPSDLEVIAYRTTPEHRAHLERVREALGLDSLAETLEFGVALASRRAKLDRPPDRVAKGWSRRPKGGGPA